MGLEVAAMATTAAFLGIVHTLLGPDHYVPFIVLARTRGWSPARATVIAVACGVGHVLGSVGLGIAAILLGWAVVGVEAFEGLRADLAAWALIGFGVAYAAWGVRRALRARPHAHLHAHSDGTVHDHHHIHYGEHGHVHDGAADGAHRRTSVTPWALFVIFVLGPCEPLVPLFMIPAARQSWTGVLVVTLVFGCCTLATMAAATWAGVTGLQRLRVGAFERYAHVVAGLALVACGLAMRLGL